MTRARLQALFLLQGAATGLLLPFVVPILSERGVDPVGIGLVLGLSAATTLAAYPAWGVLADTRLGRVPVLRLSAAIAAIAGLAIAAGGAEIAVVAVAVCGVSVGASPWGPVSDAVALESLGAASSDYGRIRRWGSLGWAVSAVAGGALYVALGPAAPPVAFAAASLGVAVVVGRPTTRPGMVTRPAGEGARPLEGGPPKAELTAPQPGLHDLLGLLRASPALVGFWVGIFVVSCGGSAAGSFLPLAILDSGGGPLLIGLAAALPALVEIPFFSGTGAIAGRIGLRGLFVVGSVATALQFAVVAVAPDPWVITGVRTIDGAAFALRYAAIVLVVGACLPDRYRALGQSTTWLIAGGIAPILADPVGGLVYGHWGGPALFAAAAITVTIGAAIVFVVLDRPLFRAPGRGPAPSSA